jgi:hypothetical protein
MTPPADPPERTLAPSVVYTSLPGPTRKRARSAYCFRLTYRSAEPSGSGCALLWEVEGGRLPYQIALEREDGGGLRYHCTCADAVYRGEADARHVCKHVRGLLTLGRPAGSDGVIPGPQW